MASESETERDAFGRAIGKKKQDQREAKQDIAVWLRNSVQTLIEHHHRLVDIREYTLDQFVLFLDEAQRADAIARMSSVIDLSAVIGGLFDKSGKTLGDHLDSLQKVINGES